MWKEIPGFNGLYEASDDGRIRRVRRGKVLLNRVMRQETSRLGYKRVMLSVDGIRKHYLVHRLVAAAFIDNPDNLPCVNHKDESKSNNSVENLEWCTHEYNKRYSYTRHEDDMHEHLCHITRHKRVRNAEGKFSTKYNKRVVQKRKDGTYMATHENTTMAAYAVAGKYTPYILECCKGKQRTAYGYIWEFESA